MPTRTIRFKSGFGMREDELKNIAEKLAKLIMSELPEEIRTYEVAAYMLEMIEAEIGAMEIAL